MEITQVNEFEITKSLRSDLQILLSGCFPGFLDRRIYFKQLPNFRLICNESNQLLGQTGVVHRVVNLDGKAVTIFGVADLCVSTSSRSKGIGRKLLSEVEKLAAQYNIDYVILFADNRRLYESVGYSLREMKCTWLKIDEHKTIGVGVEDINDCLMVKSISGEEWPNQSEVDLLGYMF